MTEARASTLKRQRIHGPHISEVIHKKQRHDKRVVDRLPSEILSHIFLMSEALARKTRARTVSYNTVQEVASQVCNYWRQVAINTPALWTYIHISRPLPNPLASLYIERSGSTLLLDIDLELRSRYWRKAKICITEWHKQFTSLRQLLDYLVLHGAEFRRWKSLSISSKRTELLFTLIPRLNSESAPFLERFTFKRHWPENTANINLTSPYQRFSHGPAYDSDANILSNRYCISQSELPNLRCVDLGSVPYDFIFDRPAPLFTGLTHLKLEINRDDIWSTLSTDTFFSANSQLETLCLSAKARGGRDTLITQAPPIKFLRLRSLSISATGPRHVHWVLSVLQMIDAPALESFALELDSAWNHSYELCLAYIATGSIPTQIGHSGSSSAESIPAGVGPIYPILRSLDISKVEASYTAFEPMLLALSTVTHLSIGHHDSHLRVLSSSRNMLPNLVALQITDKCNTSAVARCLYRRWEFGVPIKDIIPRFTGYRRARNSYCSWWYEDEVTIFNKCDDVLDLDLTDDEHTCERTGSSSIAHRRY
ncbi:hypothetical protein ACGC1H_005121 [Rhizoctonia solani]|uniref:F-box domain-containing protein n=1 Tax=Rhizoctonia solani TaxID=456999 RepID=A0A8H2X4V2_9AGAM|nr:unnamed protein product [Rhizoctonia solani]